MERSSASSRRESARRESEGTARRTTLQQLEVSPDRSASARSSMQGELGRTARRKAEPNEEAEGWEKEDVTRETVMEDQHVGLEPGMTTMCSLH